MSPIFLIDMCITNKNTNAEYVAQMPCVVRPDDSQLNNGQGVFSSSNIVYLEEGDELWTENKHYNPTYGYKGVGSDIRETSFEGLLLHPV